jgi:hypothetical protein
MAENKNWEKVQLKNAIQNLNRILSNKQQNQLKKYLCNQQRLVRITFCSTNRYKSNITKPGSMLTKVKER